VHRNDEEYNCHVQTTDGGRYGESFGATFLVPSQSQTIRPPSARFAANDLRVPLNPARIQRMVLPDWMRDFRADIGVVAVARVAGQQSRPRPGFEHDSYPPP
jgi:hypothetical protein